jgi:hypothetical protein
MQPRADSVLPVMTTGRASTRSLLITLSIVVVALSIVLFVVLRTYPSHPRLESAAPTVPSSDGSRDSTIEAVESNVRPERARVGMTSAIAERVIAPTGNTTLVVSGIVRDSTSGSVQPDVDIDASASPLPGDKSARTSTKTDAQGRYEVKLEIPSDLPWDPNVWAVQIQVRGDRFITVFDQLRPGDFNIDPTDPGESAVTRDITIKLLFALRGRLVREADGFAIAGGNVELVSLADAPMAPQSIAMAMSDGAGQFLIRFESAVPGKVAVFCSARGFLAKMVPASSDTARTVDVGDIPLAEGACLEGLVVTADGSLPPAREIYAGARGQNEAWMFVRSGTWATRNGALVPRDVRAPIGTDGSFRLCGLAPGDYSLSLAYSGCRTGSRIDTLDVRAPAAGVRLQISAAVYRLRVFDARSGKALDRAQFIFAGSPELGCWIEQDYVIATDPGLESAGRIVAEGHRALKCILPALAPSEVREMEFRLEPLPPQVAATIVVTSPTGAPVVDIELDIRSDAPETEGQGPLPKSGNGAADGRHTLPKLVPGAYHIDVEPRRQDDPAAEMWLGATLEVSVREGMDPIKLQLLEGGLVSAVVKKSNGEPVDVRTSLVRTAEGEPEPLDWRNDAGSFGGWIPKQTSVRLAKPLPVGRWKLRFDADGCKKKEVDVNVDGGRTTAIEVVLEPAEPR